MNIDIYYKDLEDLHFENTNDLAKDSNSQLNAIIFLNIQYAPREMDHIQNHILNLKFLYIKSQRLITTSSRVSVIMLSST